MNPTQLLMDEHRLIEQVLDCLDRMADQCRENDRLDGQAARDALEFFRQYADRCHHGKEEDRLFPLMELRGFSAESGPVAVMRMDHEQGRESIRGMELAIDGASAGEERAIRDWLNHAGAYLVMLRSHIQKEDHCLFPMADRALDQNDRSALAAEFERIERDGMGPEFKQRFEKLADRLADLFGVEKVRASAS